MDELISTADAAKQLDCTPGYLRVVLKRNPDLQPRMKFNGTWVWTKDEIERVAERNKKVGRPAKQSD